MGLLDDLLGNSSLIQDLTTFASENPQIVQAALRLLNPDDTGVGGSQGLGELLAAFQKQGLGQESASWVAQGQNAQVSASQLESVLGPDTIGDFAREANLGGGDASTVLAGVLPGLIDQLTPGGQMPDSSGLGGLLKGLAGEFKL